MTDLKLIALDPEDLQVVSAHLQDAVLKVADIAYLPQANRFAAVVNRFDWTTAVAETDGPRRHEASAYARCRTALRFERVLAAQTKGIRLDDRDRVLNLLAIAFEASAADGDPSGFISLIFAGDAGIRLQVECIEAELRDLGGTWSTTSKPDHDTH